MGTKLITIKAKLQPITTINLLSLIYLTIYRANIMKFSYRFFLLCGVLLLSSCAQNSLRIGNAVKVCCPGNYASYHSFGVTTEEIPLFMRDYVVSEFVAAFEEKGLAQNDRINDLKVELSYRHVNLNAEQQDIDPFVRQPIMDGESMDVQLRYIATIDITMRETATNKVVWAGEVHRIHTVSPGEYMHTPRAMSAFRETFRDLLQHYPSPQPASP